MFEFSNNLPDLKKQRQHKEADITPLVIDWFEKNYPDSVAVEVKVKKNKAKSHQLLALWQVLKGCFSYKLPDMGRRNPFDFFVLKNAKAFVVTCQGRNCQAVSPDKKEVFRFKV